MIDIDLRTATFFIALLYLAMPAVTWLVLARHRSPLVNLSCMGGLLQGVAILLFSHQGFIPSWASPSLVFLCIVLSGFFYIQALRIDLGVPWRISLIGLFLLLLVVTFEIVHRVLNADLWRPQLASAVHAILLLQVSHLAWRISRLEHSFSARWVAGTFLLMAGAQIFRFFYLGSMYPMDQQWINQNSLALGVSIPLMNMVASQAFVAMLGSMALITSAVVSQFAFIGIALERSVNRELAMVEERGRNEERRKLGDQIAHLDRQRSLGELSASLGHEINQPLATILTNVQTAKRGMETGYFTQAQVIELLDKTAQSTRRASQIVDRIRSFIRPSDLLSAPVDLNAVISEAIQLVRDEASGKKIAFHRLNEFQPVMVSGDSIQLSQIVFNVLRNAMEAMATVNLKALKIQCRQEGDWVSVKIRDTGSGLSQAILEEVGAPFFTTKSKGLGMGIAISRSIAVQHGGALTISNVDPEEGRGALVELRLPALHAAVP